MVSWPRLVADRKAAGIQRAVKLTGALIAATAVEHGLPVVTQDVVTQDNDYEKIAEAHRRCASRRCSKRPRIGGMDG